MLKTCGDEGLWKCIREKNWYIEFEQIVLSCDYEIDKPDCVPFFPILSSLKVLFKHISTFFSQETKAKSITQ